MSALLKPVLDPGRLGRITGSRCPGVLGLSPYTTRAKVLREMVRQFAGKESEFKGNVATRHGQDNEAGAIAMYAAQSFDAVHSEQAFIVHPEHDFLAVTVDGLVGRDGMIEVKCPYRAKYATTAERPDYLAQMQLQMACSGRKWCDFVVMIDGAITVDRVTFDPDWLPSVLPTLAEFMEVYRDAISHPDNISEYCTDAERTDAEWAEAARRYLNTSAEIAVLEAAKKIQRERLLELAGDAGASGGGTQVIRSERAGSVAYAKASKDLAPDADLSAYTGKPTVIYTVRESA